jgi:hypothetical protein
VVKRDASASPSLETGQPERMTSTLDPKERKNHFIATSASPTRHRTDARAYTEMGGEKVKLDLRDEFTASAKLEQLKARYQKHVVKQKKKGGH